MGCVGSDSWNFLSSKHAAPQAVHLAQHPTRVWQCLFPAHSRCPLSATHIQTQRGRSPFLLQQLVQMSSVTLSPVGESLATGCRMLGAGMGFCSSLWHQRVARCLAQSGSSEREWTWVADPGPPLTQSFPCHLGPPLGLSEEFQAAPPDLLPAHSPTPASSLYHTLALPSRSHTPGDTVPAPLARHPPLLQSWAC